MNKVRLAIEEREQARQDLINWGYQHDLDRYQEDMILAKVGHDVGWIWFEWMDNNLVLHVCANPKHRKRCVTKHALAGIRWIGELAGADRIYTLAKDGTDVLNYVKRLGWKLDSKGWYLDV